MKYKDQISSLSWFKIISSQSFIVHNVRMVVAKHQRVVQLYYCHPGFLNISLGHVSTKMGITRMEMPFYFFEDFHNYILIVLCVCVCVRVCVRACACVYVHVYTCAQCVVFTCMHMYRHPCLAILFSKCCTVCIWETCKFS